MQINFKSHQILLIIILKRTEKNMGIIFFFTASSCYLHELDTCMQKSLIYVSYILITVYL